MQITNTKASRGDKTKELVSLTKNKYFGIYPRRQSTKAHRTIFPLFSFSLPEGGSNSSSL